MLESIENLPSKLTLGKSGVDHVEPFGCHKGDLRGQGRTSSHTPAGLKSYSEKCFIFPKRWGTLPSPRQIDTPFGPLLSTPNGQRFQHWNWNWGRLAIRDQSWGSNQQSEIKIEDQMVEHTPDDPLKDQGVGGYIYIYIYIYLYIYIYVYWYWTYHKSTKRK